MKKTYFLDKIYNANFKEFDNITKAIIEHLNQSDFPFTFVKKGNKWLIEIEKDNELISVLFDDYSMFVYSSLKNVSENYSEQWQSIFYKFLHKNQKYYYKKGLSKFELENSNTKINKDEIIDTIKL